MGMLNTLPALAAAAVMAGGCASAPRHADDDAASVPAGVVTGNDDPPGFSLSRKAAAAGHAGWIYARSVYENPINRPVSHLTSLGSLALQSGTGLLRRVAIGTAQMPALEGPVPPVANAAMMDLEAFERKLDRVTGTRSDTGRIEFLVDGEEYFARLVESIENADSSVDIRTYIFDNDDFAVSIARLLRERSADVRIRIMLDSIGNMLAVQADPTTLPIDHQHPLSMRRYLENGSDVKVRFMTNPWFTGDHTKTTIVDRKVAFVGGMNIGREYRFDWHDLMMEVTGPVVDQLQFESDKAWSRGSLFGDLANALRVLRGKDEQAGRGGYPVRILQTRNFDADIYKAQITAIRSARRRILIENAYFSDDRILYELARARRRGVDVRVIIPSQGNHGPLNASNRVTINQLLRHGIRVYEYPGMSHVKAAIYDGWICVGSANFDKLSLEVNRELNLATSDPATVDALLEKVFIPDLAVSREITSAVDVTIAARLVEIAVDELL